MREALCEPLGQRPRTGPGGDENDPGGDATERDSDGVVDSGGTRAGSAATYSPTGLLRQYHPRCGA